MRNKIFQLKNKKAKIVNFLKIKDKIFQLNNKKTKITNLKKNKNYISTFIILYFQLNLNPCNFY